MTLNLGQSTINKLYLGTTEIAKCYLGNIVVYEKQITPGGDIPDIPQDGARFTFYNAETGNLKYWTGTEADYTGLATKDADTLYRTTDTNKVYLGTIQIGGGS